MAKRSGKFVKVDADPSGELDFDGIHVASPSLQRERLQMLAKNYGGPAAARKAFESHYGYKPTV